MSRRLFLILILCLPALVLADVKTEERKVARPAAYPASMPKSSDITKYLDRNGVWATWAMCSYTVNGTVLSYRTRDGMHVGLVTPELLSSWVHQQAESKVLTDADTAKLWTDSVEKFGVSKTSFVGYLEMDGQRYGQPDIDTSGWTFALLTDDGRRLDPTAVEIGSSIDHPLSRYYNVPRVWQRPFLVSFDYPITERSKSATLAMGSKFGQVRAKFVFAR